MRMKLDISNWLFQRALVSNTSVSSLRKTITAVDAAGQRALDAQTKRLNDMQNALSQLRAMPSYKVSSKHAAAERAAMLKKQLDMLKQLMVGATPSQARAIAAQVKAIAKELVSLASNLSGGGDTAAAQDSAAAVTKVADVGTGNTASADAASAVAADTGQEAVDAISASQAANGRLGVAAYAAQNSRNAQSPQSASGNDGMEKQADEALRKALEEARNALRALVSMLKSKIGTSNKDMEEASGQLAELDRILADAGGQTTSVQNP